MKGLRNCKTTRLDSWLILNTSLVRTLIGEIILIDEIHTPDSSRYFYLDSYDDLQSSKLPQRQLSKEFVRQWLIGKGFQGKKNQIVPEMSDEYIKTVSDRYIELYENITGEPFKKANVTSKLELNPILIIILNPNE